MLIQGLPISNLSGQSEQMVSQQFLIERRIWSNNSGHDLYGAVGVEQNGSQIFTQESQQRTQYGFEQRGFRVGVDWRQLFSWGSWLNRLTGGYARGEASYHLNTPEKSLSHDFRAVRSTSLAWESGSVWSLAKSTEMALGLSYTWREFNFRQAELSSSKEEQLDRKNLYLLQPDLSQTSFPSTMHSRDLGFFVHMGIQF